MPFLISCLLTLWVCLGSADAHPPAAQRPTAESAPPPQVVPGIWIGSDELMARPTSGEAWERLVRDAERDPGRADIADQDSDHDVYTLASALVCARTGEQCAKARRGVVDAIGTETGGHWLAVGRNLGAYVIAADLLHLRADGTPDSDGTRVQTWIESWLTKELPDVFGEARSMSPFQAGANAAAQQGFAFAAVAAYLGDREALDRAWDAFRTFTCDPGAPNRERINLRGAVRDGWAHDEDAPCAIAPRGATRGLGIGAIVGRPPVSLDGAIIADMRRGGRFRWPPGYTQYPWVGLEGLVPAALILQRAGYPAFDVSDRAVLRAIEFLWSLRIETGDQRWFDGERAREIVHLVNFVYDTSYPVVRVTGRGRTVGYTDWTHPVR